jgi:uracil-DNA glycosylase family 4
VAARVTSPGRNCPLCPRLVAFREAWRAREPSWFNAPVPPFGPRDARLLIVGLAPGLRGANRTGRPFTGDWAGDLLYATLLAFGFARGTYDERPDDGLTLVDCRIANAVSCVPPENKPTPAEIKTCRRYLTAEIAEMPNLRAIVALGRVAHDTVIATLDEKRSRLPFGHGSVHPACPDPVCRRQPLRVPRAGGATSHRHVRAGRSAAAQRTRARALALAHGR